MLGKIIKFVIISRISKPLLVLLIFLVIYAVFLSPFSAGTSTNFLRYYGPAVMAFVLALPAISGGIAVMKSDRDYLFPIPLKRMDLAIALFIVQFISFGFILLYMYSFVSYIRSEFPFSLVVFVALALTATSLGPITYSLKLRWRVLLSLALVAWTFSPLFGIPFSPSAIFTGETIFATVTSIILAAVATTLAFRALTNVDLDVMRTFVRYSSSETKRTKSFLGLSPMQAIMAENFQVVEISSRMNMMGAGSTYRFGRFKIIWGIAITTVIAILYYIFVAKYSPSKDLQVFLILVASYSSIIVMFMSMGVLGNERLWLGFLAINPNRYLKTIIGAKALSFAVLLLPIIIANFILAFQGYKGALGFGLSLLFNYPSLFVIVVYLSAYLSPIQIKEEVMMPSQFNLKQMATALPLLAVIVLNDLSIVVVVASVGCAVVLIAALLLLNSRRVGTRIIQKLVENGFV